ncbi:putative peptidoglycan N-acetylmuramoylhydrolase [Magnetofaba australis IT-1]|uniref:Putative peptidoglycan N-acetylmuramoylhydrolase n=1 Tax=Magnetofaba australis IT-1 TaxID=1434232 RepID=A0A1Y2K5E2_9PROT|nr:putative peptidoglycan N-acetylmuramoylhydrolase [Magnetofaba australis IT-1]
MNQTLSGLKPYPKAARLMDRQAEAKPYWEYRNLFINDAVVRKGRARLREHRALLNKIQGKYGVPAEVVVALWGIESRFGGNTGRHPVLRVLFSLSQTYERRQTFFRKQLHEFLILCHEEGWNPREPMGSYAGAMSQAQMIPGTLRRYAVDFDGDGHRDVFHSTPDVLASIANYLSSHGWKRGGLYTLPLKADRKLDALVVSAPKKLTAWSHWRGRGAQLAEAGVSLPDSTPSALIKLAERGAPRYHVVFNNFTTVMAWNRSRRFAMVAHELASRIGAQ